MSLNPRIASIEPSVIRSLNDRKKPTSIDLGLGEPTLFPTMRYFELATQWVRSMAAGTRRTPVTRSCVRRLPSTTAIRDYAAENVIATPGSQEAVYLTIKALLDSAKDALWSSSRPSLPTRSARRWRVSRCSALACAEDGFAFDAERIAAAYAPNANDRDLLALQSDGARDHARQVEQSGPSCSWRAAASPSTYCTTRSIASCCLRAMRVGSPSVYPHTIVVNSLSKSNALTGCGWAGCSRPRR